MKNPELLRNSCLIDGAWLTATGASLEVRNPANGELDPSAAPVYVDLLVAEDLAPRQAYLRSFLWRAAGRDGLLLLFTMAVLVWGGLRGGVSVALALTIDPLLNQNLFLSANK